MPRKVKNLSAEQKQKLDDELWKMQMQDLPYTVHHYTITLFGILPLTIAPLNQRRGHRGTLVPLVGSP